MSSRTTVHSLLPLLLAIAVLGACRDQQPGTFTRMDSGSTTTTCNTTQDCGGQGICVSGVCERVTSCTTDDQCASEGKVCHSRRFYCVECDGTHPNECPQGETCQFDFTCVMIGSNRPDGGAGDGSACSGSCIDRTMCGADQVCKNGTCCAPPARCFSPADCPTSRPECNGATGQCFGGDSCVTDTDCNTQPGCAAGACFCDPQTTTCRARPDECQSDTDCYNMGNFVQKFCTITSPPKRCATAASCTSDVQCAQSGLVCDVDQQSPSFGYCKNGMPCPNGNECNPTTESCQSGVCVQRNCLNTPNLCSSSEQCNASTGMCEPIMSGSCTSNAQCPADRWCDTAANPPTCALGCRDSSGCAPMQVCDANHQCTGGAGDVCGPCSMDSECPAGTHCLESFGVCYEPCSDALGMPCTLRPGATCNFGNCSCFF